MSKKGKISILFICLGNICRSPAANAIMQKMVDDNGCSDQFEIDSAGVGNWHVGNLPDKRMREHGGKRGYSLDHRARQFSADTDFDMFDYIVTMDDENYRNITSMARSDEERQKVVKMSRYFKQYPEATAVPDPYYGGEQGFERALDLIEDGCRNLLEEVRCIS